MYQAFDNVYERGSPRNYNPALTVRGSGGTANLVRVPDPDIEIKTYEAQAYTLPYSLELDAKTCQQIRGCAERCTPTDIYIPFSNFKIGNPVWEVIRAVLRQRALQNMDLDDDLEVRPTGLALSLPGS